MNGKSDIPDISYFRLSLVDFLRESHPHMVNDRKFIAARTEAALNVYEKAILDDDNPLEAGEQANKTLFEGLCFSRYDMVKNIFWNEFSKEIPQKRGKKKPAPKQGQPLQLNLFSQSQTVKPIPAGQTA
jgi:hypothetical protein